MRSDDKTIEATYAHIVEAVRANVRCPLNTPFGPLSSAAVRALNLSGRIKTEIYPRNYRVITLMDGELAGMHTLRPAGRVMKPVRVLHKGVTRINPVTRVTRQEPSKPRPLTTEELKG